VDRWVSCDLPPQLQPPSSKHADFYSVFQMVPEEDQGSCVAATMAAGSARRFASRFQAGVLELHVCHAPRAVAAVFAMHCAPDRAPQMHPDWQSSLSCELHLAFDNDKSVTAALLGMQEQASLRRRGPECASQGHARYPLQVLGEMASQGHHALLQPEAMYLACVASGLVLPNQTHEQGVVELRKYAAAIADAVLQGAGKGDRPAQANASA
jgi:hypothetical protein